jgi:hypothetical protein
MLAEINLNFRPFILTLPQRTFLTSSNSEDEIGITAVVYKNNVSRHTTQVSHKKTNGRSPLAEALSSSLSFSFDPEESKRDPIP